jgi:CBS domain containing-hemolysin-like protein
VIAVAWSASDTYLAISVFVLLNLSGFFALAETSLVRMNKSRARSLRDEGRRGARSLVSLTEDLQRFLNPLLLLVLVCQLVSATMVGVLAGHLFGGAGVFVATVGEVVVIFVIFEAIPKNFAVQHPDGSALTAAPVVGAILKFWPIKMISKLLLAIADGVIGLFGTTDKSQQMTESDILNMADVAHEDDAIESEERNFIHSVIEFGDTVVREVMVPRPDMVAVDHDQTVSAALELGLTAGYSRLPVEGEDADDILGVAFTKDLVRLERSGRGAAPVSEAMRPAKFVPETKRVATLLAEMQAENVHLAVVVDEYGGTAGLVTLEDVLEELVGDIRDEFDREEPEVTEQGNGVVVVSGRMSIDEVDELLGEELPKGSWDTIGGLAFDLAGGVPEEGQVLETEPFRITIERIEGRRILQVRIERATDRASS